MIAKILDPRFYVELIETCRARVFDPASALSVALVQRSQRLTKDPDDYATKTKQDGEESAQSAHVVVAKILRKRGEQVGKGSKVAYVVTDGSTTPAKAIPADDYVGELDRHYLWEQLVYPPTMRVLQAAFPAASGPGAPPAPDWTDYERTRPPKPRVRVVRVDPRQLKLFG